MVSGLINENPIIYAKKERRVRTDSNNTDEFAAEPIDQLEIFDILYTVLIIIKYYYLQHFTIITK